MHIAHYFVLAAGVLLVVVGVAAAGLVRGPVGRAACVVALLAGAFLVILGAQLSPVRH